MFHRNSIKNDPKKQETRFLHRQKINQKSKLKLKHRSNLSYEEVCAGKVSHSLTKLEINNNNETNMIYARKQDETNALDNLKYKIDTPHQPQRNRHDRKPYQSRIYETANTNLYKTLKNKPSEYYDRTRYESLCKMREKCLDPVAKALHMEDDQNRNIFFEPLIKDKFPSKNIEDNIILQKPHAKKKTNFRPLLLTKKLKESIDEKESSIVRPTAFYPSECGRSGCKEFDFTFLI